MPNFNIGDLVEFVDFVERGIPGVYVVNEIVHDGSLLLVEYGAADPKTVRVPAGDTDRYVTRARPGATANLNFLRPPGQ